MNNNCFIHYINISQSNLTVADAEFIAMEKVNLLHLNKFISYHLLSNISKLRNNPNTIPGKLFNTLLKILKLDSLYTIITNNNNIELSVRSTITDNETVFNSMTSLDSQVKLQLVDNYTTAINNIQILKVILKNARAYLNQNALLSSADNSIIVNFENYVIHELNSYGETLNKLREIDEESQSEPISDTVIDTEEEITENEVPVEQSDVETNEQYEEDSIDQESVNDTPNSINLMGETEGKVDPMKKVSSEMKFLLSTVPKLDYIDNQWKVRMVTIKVNGNDVEIPSYYNWTDVYKYILTNIKGHIRIEDSFNFELFKKGLIELLKSEQSSINSNDIIVGLLGLYYDGNTGTFKTVNGIANSTFISNINLTATISSDGKNVELKDKPGLSSYMKAFRSMLITTFGTTPIAFSAFGDKGVFKQNRANPIGAKDVVAGKYMLSSIFKLNSQDNFYYYDKREIQKIIDGIKVLLLKEIPSKNGKISNGRHTISNTIPIIKRVLKKLRIYTELLEDENFKNSIASITSIIVTIKNNEITTVSQNNLLGDILTNLQRIIDMRISENEDMDVVYDEINSDINILLTPSFKKYIEKATQHILPGVEPSFLSVENKLLYSYVNLNQFISSLNKHIGLNIIKWNAAKVRELKTYLTALFGDDNTPLEIKHNLFLNKIYRITKLSPASASSILNEMEYGIVEGIMFNESKKALDKSTHSTRIIAYLLGFQTEYDVQGETVTYFTLPTTANSPIKRFQKIAKYFKLEHSTDNKLVIDDNGNIVNDGASYKELKTLLTGPKVELNKILDYYSILSDSNRFEKLNKNERHKLLMGLSFIRYDKFANDIPKLFLDYDDTLFDNNDFNQNIKRLFTEFGVMNRKVVLNPQFINIIGNTASVIENEDGSSPLYDLLQEAYLNYLILSSNQITSEVMDRIVSAHGHKKLIYQTFFDKKINIGLLPNSISENILVSYNIKSLLSSPEVAFSTTLSKMQNSITVVYKILELVEQYNKNMSDDNTIKLTLGLLNFNHLRKEADKNNIPKDKIRILDQIYEIAYNNDSLLTLNIPFSANGKKVTMYSPKVAISKKMLADAFIVFNSLMDAHVNKELNSLSSLVDRNDEDSMRLNTKIDNYEFFENMSLGFVYGEDGKKTVGFYNNKDFGKLLITHLVFEHNVNNYLHHVAMHELLSGDMSNYVLYDNENNEVMSIDTLFNYLKRNASLRSLMVPHDEISSKKITRSDIPGYTENTDIVSDENVASFYNGFIDDLVEESDEIRKTIILRENIKTIKSVYKILFPVDDNISAKDKKILKHIRKAVRDEDYDRMFMLNGHLSRYYHEFATDYIFKLRDTDPTKYQKFYDKLTDHTYFKIKKTDASDQATFIFFLKRAKSYGYISHYIADELIAKIEKRISNAKEYIAKGKYEDAVRELDYSDIIADKDAISKIVDDVKTNLKKLSHSLGDIANLKDLTLDNIMILVLKDVYVKDLYNPNLKINELLFDKNATRVLLPTSLRGQKLDTLRMIMELRGIDRVSVPSAIKTNVSQIVYPALKKDQFWHKKFGNIKDALDWSIEHMTILELPSSGFGEQTMQSDSSKGLFSSQVKSVIYTGQNDTTKIYKFEQVNGETIKLQEHSNGSESFKKAQLLWKRLYFEKQQSFVKKISNAEGKIDSSKFIEYLKKNLMHSTSINENDVDGLITLENIVRSYTNSSLDLNIRNIIQTIKDNPDLNRKLTILLSEKELNESTLTEFAIPIMFMPNSFKIQSIMNSLIETRIVSNGLKGILIPDLISQDGFNFEDYEKNIVYTNPSEWNGKRKLKDSRYEDGIMKPSQVVVSWNFKGYVKKYYTMSLNNNMVTETTKSEYDESKSFNIHKKSNKVIKELTPAQIRNIFSQLSSKGINANRAKIVIKNGSYVIQVLSSKKEVLDINDYLLKEGDKGYIKGKTILNTKLLPRELLRGFGTRIPTQEKASMAYFEIVGFVTGLEKSLIIAPSDFVIRMGSDFDVDTLYSLLYSYNHDPYTNAITFVKYYSKRLDKKQYYKKYIQYLIHVFDNTDMYDKVAINNDDKINIKKMIRDLKLKSKDYEELYEQLMIELNEKLNKYDEALEKLNNDEKQELLKLKQDVNVKINKPKYLKSMLTVDNMNDKLEMTFYLKKPSGTISDIKKIKNVLVTEDNYDESFGKQHSIDKLKELLLEYNIDINELNSEFDTEHETINEFVIYYINSQFNNIKIIKRIRKKYKFLTGKSDITEELTHNDLISFLRFDVFEKAIDAKNAIFRYYEYVKSLSNKSHRVDDIELSKKHKNIRDLTDIILMSINSESPNPINWLDNTTPLNIAALNNTRFTVGSNLSDDIDEEKLKKLDELFVTLDNDIVKIIDKIKGKIRNLWNGYSTMSEKNIISAIDDIRNLEETLKDIQSNVKKIERFTKDNTELDAHTEMLDMFIKIHKEIRHLTSIADSIYNLYKQVRDLHKYINTADFKLRIANNLREHSLNIKSFQEFKELDEASQNTVVAVENKLKDSYITIFVQPPNLESILQSLDYGNVYKDGKQHISDKEFEEFKQAVIEQEKNTIDLLKDLLGKYSFASIMDRFNDQNITPDMFSWYYNELMYSQFKSSGIVISTMALNQVILALLGISENLGKRYKYMSEKSNINSDVIEFADEDGNPIINNDYGDSKMVKDDIFEGTEYKYREGSLYISLGVDDSKIQTVGRINLTPLDLNSVMGLLANGFGNHWVIFLINQKIIKDLNKLYENDIDSGSSHEMAFSSAFESLFESYVERIQNSDLKDRLRDDLYGYLKDNVPLKLSSLLESLIITNETDNYILIQLKTLYNYVIAYDQGAILSTLSTSISTDSKGTPPTYNEILARVEKFEKLFDNFPITNIENFFGKVTYIKYNSRLPVTKQNPDTGHYEIERLFDLLKMIEGKRNNPFAISEQAIYKNLSLTIDQHSADNNIEEIYNFILSNGSFNTLSIYEKLFLFKYHIEHKITHDDNDTVYNDLHSLITLLLNEADKNTVLEPSFLFNEDIYKSISNYNVDDIVLGKFLSDDSEFKEIYKLMSDVIHNIRLSNVIIEPNNYKSFAIKDGLLFPRRLYSKYFKSDTVLYKALLKRLEQLGQGKVYRNEKNSKTLDKFLTTFFISSQFSDVNRDELKDNLINQHEKLTEYITTTLQSNDLDPATMVKLKNYKTLLFALQTQGENKTMVYNLALLQGISDAYQIYQSMFFDDTTIPNGDTDFKVTDFAENLLRYWFIINGGQYSFRNISSIIPNSIYAQTKILKNLRNIDWDQLPSKHDAERFALQLIQSNTRLFVPASRNSDTVFKIGSIGKKLITFSYVKNKAVNIYSFIIAQDNISKSPIKAITTKSKGKINKAYINLSYLISTLRLNPEDSGQLQEYFSQALKNPNHIDTIKKRFGLNDNDINNMIKFVKDARFDEKYIQLDTLGYNKNGHYVVELQNNPTYPIGFSEVVENSSPFGYLLKTFLDAVKEANDEGRNLVISNNTVDIIQPYENKPSDIEIMANSELNFTKNINKFTVFGQSFTKISDALNYVLFTNNGKYDTKNLVVDTFIKDIIAMYERNERIPNMNNYDLNSLIAKLLYSNSTDEQSVHFLRDIIKNMDIKNLEVSEIISYFDNIRQNGIKILSSNFGNIFESALTTNEKMRTEFNTFEKDFLGRWLSVQANNHDTISISIPSNSSYYGKYNRAFSKNNVYGNLLRQYILYRQKSNINKSFPVSEQDIQNLNSNSDVNIVVDEPTYLTLTPNDSIFVYTPFQYIKSQNLLTQNDINDTYLYVTFDETLAGDNVIYIPLSDDEKEILNTRNTLHAISNRTLEQNIQYNNLNAQLNQILSSYIELKEVNTDHIQMILDSDDVNTMLSPILGLEELQNFNVLSDDKKIEYVKGRLFALKRVLSTNRTQTILDKYNTYESILRYLDRKSPRIITKISDIKGFSGAADGADKTWKNKGKLRKIDFTDFTVRSLSKLLPKHLNKAILEYKKAATALQRPILDMYSDNSMIAHSAKLMIRDFLQVIFADGIFAVSDILKPTERSKPTGARNKRYPNNTNKEVVDGGTGYAVQMGITLGLPIYVYHQKSYKDMSLNEGWYKWNYTTNEFDKMNTIPILTKNFAGIGTRTLTKNGEKAIEDVYKATQEWLDKRGDSIPQSTIIPLNEKFNRTDVEKDTEYMYLFTDNASRTSGSFAISDNSIYSKKYGTGKKYPSKTQAVIRGLNNAFPITTMVDSKRKQWTDNDFDEYKKIIDDEIETIKVALASDKYKGLKYSAINPFGIGEISKLNENAPILWGYLNEKLTEIGINNDSSEVTIEPSKKLTTVKNFTVLNEIKSLPVYSNEGVNTLRNASLDKIENFGNPFIGSVRYKGKDIIDNITVFGTVAEADEAYRKWLTNKKLWPGNSELSLEEGQKKREWILEQINSGNLDGKVLLYYKPTSLTQLDGTIISDYHSHADTLAELVNAKNGIDTEDKTTENTSKLLSIEELKQNSVPEQDAIKFIRKDNQNNKEYFEEFSNFIASDIEITDDLGLKYKSVEAYYQAQKTLDENERKQFTSDKLKTPVQYGNTAKKLGRTVTLRKDWETVKYDIMREGLRQKFQDTKFMNLLKSTGNKQIIEWTWWDDRIWGMSDKTNNGANALGKLLMELRDQSKSVDESIITDSDKIDNTTDSSTVAKKIIESEKSIVLDLGIDPKIFRSITPKIDKKLVVYIHELKKANNTHIVTVNKYKRIQKIDLLKETDLIKKIERLLTGHQIENPSAPVVKQYNEIILTLRRLLAKPEYKFIIDRIANNIDNINTKNFKAEGLSRYPYLLSFEQLLEFIKSALFPDYNQMTSTSISVNYEHKFNTLNGDIPKIITHILLTKEDYDTIFSTDLPHNIALSIQNSILYFEPMSKKYKSLFKLIPDIDIQNKINIPVKEFNDLQPDISNDQYYSISLTFLNTIPKDKIGKKIMQKILELAAKGKVRMNNSAKSAFIKKYILIFTSISTTKLTDELKNSYIVSVRPYGSDTNKEQNSEDVVLLINDIRDESDNLKKLKMAIEIIEKYPNQERSIIKQLQTQHLILSSDNSLKDLQTTLDNITNC